MPNGLKTQLLQLDADIQAFSDGLRVVEAMQEGRQPVQKEEMASSDRRELDQSWFDVQRGLQYMLQAKEMLKKEIEEDEWLIVLRS